MICLPGKWATASFTKESFMSRGMMPTDLFRIQWISDARLSPDGRLIAFTVTRLDEEADD
jgi:hypothetical protein